MTEEVLGKDMTLLNDDLQFSNNQDFQVTKFKNNLAQAIVSRIKTIKGEYYNVEYGGEVNKTIGRPRNDTTLNQLNGYIIEVLKQEPRIKSIQELKISFVSNTPDAINVELVIVPIDSQVSLNLIFPLFLS